MTVRHKHSPKTTFGLMVLALVLVAAVSGVAIASPTSTPHKSKAVAASSGRRGPRGFTGRRGHTGRTGAAGVVPQIKLVDSEHLTLNPGQNTYDVDPNNFQANCPAGYTAIGTGFATGIGNADLVKAYGAFVGGFIHNDTSVQVTDVYVQAICGRVPGGAATAAVDSSASAYHATLQRLAALHR